MKSDAAAFGRAVRDHWGIENGLHWCLDIVFREDASRIRMGNAASNMVVLRHMALNTLKREKTLKRGLKNKRLRAGWNEEYLVQLLGLLTA